MYIAIIRIKRLKKIRKKVENRKKRLTNAKWEVPRFRSVRSMTESFDADTIYSLDVAVYFGVIKNFVIPPASTAPSRSTTRRIRKRDLKN
jgi:hypothetical protein